METIYEEEYKKKFKHTKNQIKKRTNKVSHTEEQHTDGESHIEEQHTDGESHIEAQHTDGESHTEEQHTDEESYEDDKSYVIEDSIESRRNKLRNVRMSKKQNMNFMQYIFKPILPTTVKLKTNRVETNIDMNNPNLFHRISGDEIINNLSCFAKNKNSYNIIFIKNNQDNTQEIDKISMMRLKLYDSKTKSYFNKTNSKYLKFEYFVGLDVINELLLPKPKSKSNGSLNLVDAIVFDDILENSGNDTMENDTMENHNLANATMENDTMENDKLENNVSDKDKAFYLFGELSEKRFINFGIERLVHQTFRTVYLHTALFLRNLENCPNLRHNDSDDEYDCDILHIQVNKFISLIDKSILLFTDITKIEKMMKYFSGFHDEIISDIIPSLHEDRKQIMITFSRVRKKKSIEPNSDTSYDTNIILKLKLKTHQLIDYIQRSLLKIETYLDNIQENKQNLYYQNMAEKKNKGNKTDMRSEISSNISEDLNKINPEMHLLILSLLTHANIMSLKHIYEKTGIRPEDFEYLSLQHIIQPSILYDTNCDLLRYNETILNLIDYNHEKNNQWIENCLIDWRLGFFIESALKNKIITNLYPDLSPGNSILCAFSNRKTWKNIWKQNKHGEICEKILNISNIPDFQCNTFVKNVSLKTTITSKSTCENDPWDANSLD